MTDCWSGKLSMDGTFVLMPDAVLSDQPFHPQEEASTEQHSEYERRYHHYKPAPFSSVQLKVTDSSEAVAV